MARVVICAENPVIRAGLATMVASTEIAVVAQLDTVGHLRDWLQTQPIDLVLLALPELTSGLTQDIVQLVTDWPFEVGLSVLLLLELWDEPTPSGPERASGSSPWRRQLTLTFLTAGISIVPLTVSAEQVKQAIAAILAGFVVVHPDITEALTGASNLSVETGLAIAPSLDPLTPREVDVLNQLSAGLSNKEIAHRLTISEHTVKFHISAILAKLGVSSRTEAVAVGIRAGLVVL